MYYSQGFFEVQLSFAGTLARRFDLPIGEALYNYTTFTKSLGITDESDWERYLTGLHRQGSATEWTYQWYVMRRGLLPPPPSPLDTTYLGRPLFGCFYYLVRDETIIRPHFVTNDGPGGRPLSAERLRARKAELRRMMEHIREHEPQARTVAGNSWLYNLEAYRRIFPPDYVAEMPASQEDEFQYLALWGQVFDRRWQPRPEVAQEILRRAADVPELSTSALLACFPLRVLQPQAPIEVFFEQGW